ncbi:PREDICTED: short transient receptor potential channel 5-like [Branchiostoma belcheri]|uniref:Short transient receptor potential channel 5-like n=1 Tax=Branchiostoma belcheri TaxID=7741 RepID=A0A6P4ZSK3_BRABE|nr:PREDICTED: short transient receptor potential channel 5-like [Branchiostoma belcheri]
MEQRLFEAAENDDIIELMDILQSGSLEGSSLDINCRNNFGQSALDVAVDSGCLSAAEGLLNSGAQVGSAILYAVDRQDLAAVRMILDKRSTEDVTGSLAKENECHHSCMFSSDMTPLILAAHNNNYRILKLLLDRGFTLLDPSTYSWASGVRQSSAWLSTYRAMSSPYYILLTSDDPFFTAFTTARTLRDVCWKRENYRGRLEEMADQCETFAAELLDEVRDSEELEAVLGYSRSDQQPPYTTLEMAVDLKQKRFVSHHLCQEYGLLLDLPAAEWESWSRMYVILFNLTLCLFCPLLCLVHIIAPNTVAGRMASIPYIRDLFWSVSEVLMLAVVRWEAEYQIGRDEINKIARGDPTPVIITSYPQIIIMIWILGLLIEELQEIWYQGLRYHFTRLWNLLDFAILATYITQLVLRIIAYRWWGHYSEAFDWLVMIRAHPDIFQPVMIAEGLFAIFAVLVVLRAMGICSLSRNLGTLQISFGRMMFDILKFITILALVMFAFSCGFHRLYRYYGAVHGYMCDEHGQSHLKTASCLRPHGYATLLGTAESLFWALFGMGDLTMLELTPRAHPDPNVVFQNLGKPVFTETLGKIMFVMYHVIAVLVLLNLLIAIMNASYQITEDNKEAEWTYRRLKDMMFHRRVGLTLPPPYNLLVLVRDVLVWTWRRVSHSQRRDVGSHDNEEEDVRTTIISEERFKMVAERLAKRYILRRERETNRTNHN